MERIQKYLNRVYRASVLDRAEAFKNKGLNGPQISYILQICRSPGSTHDELASAIFVNKSSVTRQVTRLEKSGFLKREVDSDDRRVKRIYPTALALEIYPEILAYLDTWNEALTSNLSLEEEEELLKWVKLLAKRSTDNIMKHDVSYVLGIEEEEENA